MVNNIIEKYRVGQSGGFLSRLLRSLQKLGCL